MAIYFSIETACLRAAVLMVLAGCSPSGNTLEGEVVPVGTEPVICKDPRPQLCTMDYRPVCGTTKSGENKTYSNGCGACSVPSVLSYRPGECPE